MRNWIEYKISSRIAFLIIFLFILPSGYFTWKAWKNTISEIETLNKITISPPTEGKISELEKKQIDKWIKENNLNKYGDPIDTFYSGGTPLFDESTGQTIDFYQYILKKHPDRPWRK